MKFGTKKSEVTDDFDGEFVPYLRNFREGDNLVRFIDEIEDWIKFSEHYTAEGKSFPCTQDKSTCPGCTSDNEKMAKATRKYATNLQLVSNNAVLPFRIPMSLAKKLFNRAERNGTITNRDYVVMREGKGLNTDYDLEQDDKRPENVEALREQAHDIEEILASSYNEVWGPAKTIVEGKAEDIPFEKSEEIDEGTLRKMNRAELAALATKHAIEFDEDGGRVDILTAILENTK